ncbi:MAG: cytochrome P450 [Candidatus Nanopelagicales bacterium]
MKKNSSLIESLHSEAFTRDPFSVWENLRNEAPVVWDFIDKCWVVTRYEDVSAVILDHESYSGQVIFVPVIGPSMVEMDGSDHDALRSIVAPPLVGKKLTESLELISGCVSELVDTLPSSGRVDLVAQISRPLPIMVIAALLGLEPKDRDYLESFVPKIIHALPGLQPGLAVGQQAHAEFEVHIAELVEQRSLCPASDLISAIASGTNSDGGHLTSSEIATFISLLLVAGGETTDRALSNFWFLLLQNPDLIKAILKDENLLEAAITEFMRLDGVVVYVDRLTTRSVVIRGVEIPKGSTVRMALLSANNDERVFEDPRTFQLHRSDLRQGKENRMGGFQAGINPHFGFGMGKHFCIGYQLARAEMKIATSQILNLLSKAKLVEDQDALLRVDWAHRYVDKVIVEYSI